MNLSNCCNKQIIEIYCCDNIIKICTECKKSCDPLRIKDEELEDFI